MSGECPRCSDKASNVCTCPEWCGHHDCAEGPQFAPYVKAWLGPVTVYEPRAGFSCSCGASRPEDCRVES